MTYFSKKKKNTINNNTTSIHHFPVVIDIIRCQASVLIRHSMSVYVTPHQNETINVNVTFVLIAVRHFNVVFSTEIIFHTKKLNLK